MVELFGNIGYQFGVVGILTFTISFLTIVRWWTDHLGRVIAGIMISLSTVLIMTILRMLHVELPGGLLVWRVVVFWIFGAGVWIGFGSLVWAQFFAPRIRRSHLTTRREHSDEEVDLAGGGNDRDGDPDRVSGGLAG